MCRNQESQANLKKITWWQRATALMICLSMIFSFCMPVQFILPVSAADESDVPPGAYSISNDIKNVTISDVKNGTHSGATITGSEGADTVSFSMSVDFVINDTTHNKIDTSKPYIYLPISKEDLEVLLLDEAKKTGESTDSSDGWTKYRQDNSLSNSSTGTYEIFPTGDGNYGYIVLKFNQDYIDYVKQSNGIITGSLKFDGKVTRDAAQSGDKEIKIGNTSIAVDFDERIPVLDKSVWQSTDEIGCPVLTWTITVKDLYETNNYLITDDMLSEAYDFTTSPEGICYLEDGKIQFNEATNYNKEFTITYKTRITPEQLQGKTSDFEVSNTVKLNGENQKTATATIHPDSEPHVSKSGTPDYLYYGDRSGELAGKNYIYWTVDVTRNYGLPLAEYTLTDTLSDKLSNLTMLSAKDENDVSISLADLFSDTSGTSWTFKEGVTEDKVTLLYRTEVSEEADGISNTIAIKNGESQTPTVDYQKNAQHVANKWGSYVAVEDATGNPIEYVDWTIEIYAKDGTNENINGYSVYDSSFGTDGFTWQTAEARNNGQAVDIGNIGDLFSTTSDNNTLRIKETSENNPELDYLKVTYRVPLGEVSGRNETTGGKVTNTFKVEKDDPKTETVDIPTLAGQATVNVNKYWANNDDPNKGQTTATFTLYCRKGAIGEWIRFSKYQDGASDIITVNGTESGNQAFTQLPAYDIEGNVRTPLYYKVEETITVPDGVTNLYQAQFTSGNQDGAKGVDNPTFGITNTWEGTNVTGIKYWKDDEGHESDRPAVQLTLQQRIANSNGDWTDVTIEGVENPKSATADTEWKASWENLPAKDTNGNEIEYRITEKNIPSGYTMYQNSNTTITNVYNNMTLTAEKYWNRVDSDDDKPDSIKVKLMRTTNGNDDSSWVDVAGSEIELLKADYENSASKLKWNDLPKKDDSGNVYYYKVVEVQETDKQKEFDVDYWVKDGSGYYVYAGNGSATIGITNNWKKTNITVTKQWQDDRGNEHYRPNIVMLLEKSEDWGNTWTEVNSVKLVNDGEGNYRPDSSSEDVQAGQSYTWKGLEAGYNIRYRVREVEMCALQRGSNSVTENGSIDTGYDTYYGYDGNVNPYEISSTDSQENRNAVVINKSNMITIRVDKVWEGVPADYRADMVGYRLYRWTETEFNALSDEEKYTDTYKFSDKYAFKSASGESDTMYWTWMLSKNEKGEQYHYGLKEIKIANLDSTSTDTEVVNRYSIDKSADYDTEITSSEVVNQNQTITVKNTWKKINVSISKVWEDGTNSAGYTSITMKLMQKIGEDGIWSEVTDASEQTVTAENGWRLDNAWTELPRETAQGQKIYYRAEEVSAEKSDKTSILIADSEDFYTRPDSAGINATGDSVVTNTPKKINIGLVKKWVSTQGTAKPATINVTLMASTNGGASWVSADKIDNSITAVKTLTVNGDTDLTDSWSNLPTKTTVSSTERDVLYKLVEDDVNGYSASYSSEAVNINSTVIITNTEKSPYTKKAANPVPSIEPTIETYVENEISKSRLTSAVLINSNDGILQNNTLSSDEMSKVDTAIVNINGVDTECYLFKWRIDMLTNNTQYAEDSNTGYVFTDTLTDGSVFYDDCGAHGIKIESNGGGNDGLYCENWSSVYDTTPSLGFDWNAHLKVTYNASKTQVTFDTQTPSNGKRVAYITYYTATPKSVVDEALESTGEFILTNRIQEAKETTPNEIELHVTGGDDVGYIDKINNTASGTENSYAVMKDGTAHYTLDVNKDSKYLSSGNTISVTDIFRILEYKSGENQQTGLDVTAVPTITNVGVFYYDTDGKRSRVDSSQYSYSTSVENGSYETSEDYSDRFTNANLILWPASNGILINSGSEGIPKGLEIIINYRGQPNTEATIAENSITNDYSTDFKGVQVSIMGDTYDSSGIVKVKLYFTEACAAGKTSGQLRLTNYIGPTPASTVESAVLKTSTPCKNYITKFTLPDGGHYEIMYDYVIKNADGTSLNSGSILTLQNEASVHTSGGDKLDESRKTSYLVQKSDVHTQVGQNFEIVKVDIGNQSIDDLNAEFKLARFEADNKQWIYADEFKYKTLTVGTSSYLSDTLHVASYSDKTETEGTDGKQHIPENSANMVLSGNYEIELDKTVLYKIIEVKAPNNHTDFIYPETPYEKGDDTVSGNSGNTYYFIYNEGGDGINALTDEELTALAEKAGITKNKIEVKNSNDPSLIVSNVRQISIGAEKIWEQDPNSAINDVQVAVQLLRSDTKDISGAVPVENQKDLLDENDKVNFDDTMNAYILKKEAEWKQEEIWLNLPDGNIETGKPYYYFVKEVAYKIGSTWYTYNSTTGKYQDTNGAVWTDVSGNSAEYKPSYTNDAISSSGVIRIVNSRKLLVKKQWQDKNGNAITNPPVTSVDFNLYGITADGTEVKITLPDDRQKLTAPNWEIEVPLDLISGDDINYIKYRVEEVTELEDYIISDVYALNGNTGVMYLINKNTNPTSVDVNVSKTWADGNDAHTAEDAVTFTLYQFTGKQTVNQAFIENFISKDKTYNGVTQVTGMDNPITLDGTESEPWQYTWKNLPFKGGANNAKLQYFVIEEQSDTTKDDYHALYTLDGNTTYKAERVLNVTNKQPGVLVVKKQWRDKTLQDNPLITNAKNPDVQVKLYRKAKSETQITDADADNIMSMYGLTDADNLITGIENVTGLNSDGTIVLGASNAWTVSLKGLDENYCYYIVEADGTGYTVSDYQPQYANEGQSPGSDKIMTVDNFVEGELITVKAKKTWSYTDDEIIRLPDAITLYLQQYDSVNKKWITIQPPKTATSSTNWEAEWTDLPASKTYQVIEDVPDGWLVTYGNQTVTGGENEIRNYPVTNTLDTGALNVKKKWLANEAGGTDSVTVELYRQAYDANGNPVSEQNTESTEDTSENKLDTKVNGNSLNSSTKIFSLSKVRKLLAEVQTEESEVQTEVVDENPAPDTVRKSTLTVKPVKTVQTNDSELNEKYISLKQAFNENIVYQKEYNIRNILNEKTITKIQIVPVSGAGRVSLYYMGVPVYGNDENNNWVILNYDDTQEYKKEYCDFNNSILEYKLENGDFRNPLTKFVWEADWGGSIGDVYFYYTPVGPEISINDPNRAIIAGDSFELTTNISSGANVTNWQSSDKTIATVDSNGTVTFKTAGTVTITATATDSSNLTKDATIELTAIPFQITNKPTDTNVTEGDTFTPASNAENNVIISVGENQPATVENGVVTFTGNGTVTVTATHGEATDTVTFTVASKGFTASIDPVLIHKDMIATITSSLDEVTWTVKNDADSSKIEINGNKITALTNNSDPIVLSGTRGTASAEVTLQIKPMLVSYNGSDVTPANLTLGVNSSLPVVNVAGTSTGTTTDENIAYYDSETHTVKTGEKQGDATITITDAGETLTFNVKVEVSEVRANVPDTAQKVQDITISAEKNWLSADVTNLPKTDGRGNIYRYFIKEESAGTFIPVAYSTSTEGAVLSDELTQLHLTNASQQSDSVELPESGGKGTRLYYTAGALLLLLSSAGYIVFKRRRWLIE